MPKRVLVDCRQYYLVTHLKCLAHYEMWMTETWIPHQGKNLGKKSLPISQQLGTSVPNFFFFKEEAMQQSGKHDTG